MIVYHRNSYGDTEALRKTTDHVVKHISAIASPSDDPDQFAPEVDVTFSENEDGSTRVYGELDREPACDYSLPDDFQLPDESEYQKGFGVREMTPEELQEHLIRKFNVK